MTTTIAPVIETISRRERRRTGPMAEQARIELGGLTMIGRVVGRLSEPARMIERPVRARIGLVALMRSTELCDLMRTAIPGWTTGLESFDRAQVALTSRVPVRINQEWIDQQWIDQEWI